MAMMNFPKEQRALELLNQALVHVASLSQNDEANLVPALNKTRATLETRTGARHHLPLVLSAARRQVAQAEKFAVGRIIGDDPVNHKEMSSLVEIRLICAELVNLLTNALDDVKGGRC
jgi:hypothetical protein